MPTVQVLAVEEGDRFGQFGGAWLCGILLGLHGDNTHQKQGAESAERQDKVLVCLHVVVPFRKRICPTQTGGVGQDDLTGCAVCTG